MKTLKTSPERLAYLAEYRKANREKLRQYQKDWADANPDKVRAKASKYVKSHKKENALKSQKWRARMRQVETYIITPKEMFRLYNQPCMNCGSKEKQTLDHKIPLSRGGRHSVGNLQTLCLSCNSKKHRRTIMEWRLDRRVAY